jgi:hypothetical protein
MLVVTDLIEFVGATSSFQDMRDIRKKYQRSNRCLNVGGNLTLWGR